MTTVEAGSFDFGPRRGVFPKVATRRSSVITKRLCFELSFMFVGKITSVVSVFMVKHVVRDYVIVIPRQ